MKVLILSFTHHGYRLDSNAHEQYDIILDDFNPLEDKIVLNPSRAGEGFTGYDLSDDGVITFTLRILVIMTMR